MSETLLLVLLQEGSILLSSSICWSVIDPLSLTFYFIEA